jgi:hypothetical protein
MSDQQVADELGYANRGTVYRIVHQALARDTREAVEELQELEGARPDALQVALWDAAMQGDVTAAGEIVRIVATRCRLPGLYGPPSPEGFAPGTVVLAEEDRTALVL